MRNMITGLPAQDQFVVPWLFRRVLYGIGALTPEGEGGIPTTATNITRGNDAGHWQIVDGYVTPTEDGDTDNLDEGPYTLRLNNRTFLQITIEAGTASIGATDTIETGTAIQ